MAMARNIRDQLLGELGKIGMLRGEKGDKGERGERVAIDRRYELLYILVLLCYYYLLRFYFRYIACACVQSV
jgi:hypothetical protein